MLLSMTKDAILKRLAEKLALAKADDAKVTLQHQKAEDVALVKFRERLKAAMKWDYATAKKREEVSFGYRERPSCPTLNAHGIARQIEILKLDMRKVESITIHEKTDLYNAVFWLPDSQQPKKTPCD